MDVEARQAPLTAAATASASPAEGGSPVRLRVLDWGWSPRALDRRVGPWGCATAWVLATAIFVSLVAIAGGPSSGDSMESTLATSAIARAEFRCAYPYNNVPATPPLYAILSGAVVAAGHLEGSVVDPAKFSVGPGCRAGRNLLAHVSPRGIRRILWVGLSMWLALLAGFVLLLRAAGRGRSRWECAGVLVLACLPPVLESIVAWFHPNDMLTIGLIAAALAAALTRRWVAAGVLAGLACTAQPFAVLGVVPLVVASPPRARVRVAGAAVITAGALVALSWMLMGIGAVHAATGRGDTFLGYGTLVDRWGLTGNALAVFARVLPLVCAALLALVGRRRAGDTLLTPAVLVSMSAICLGMRLVFETALYGYYFSAAAVFVVALDLIRGRLRVLTVAWLVLLWATFPVTGQLLPYSPTLSQLVIVGSYLVLVAPEFVRACRRPSLVVAATPTG